MALSKEVEKDFGGVPGKLEDKVDMIFEIKNSALSEDTKKVIFNSLKQLSVKNLKDCEEIGHDNEVEIDENAEKNAKVELSVEFLCENKIGLTKRQKEILNLFVCLHHSAKSNNALLPLWEHLPIRFLNVPLKLRIQNRAEQENNVKSDSNNSAEPYRRPIFLFA